MEDFVTYAAIVLVACSLMGGFWRFLDMLRDTYLIIRDRFDPENDSGAWD